jgi:exodeoxyribonuclease VII small subunit
VAAKKSTTKIDFEKSIVKLEAIVEKLESGDQTLEASLKLFEEGIQLTRRCQMALEQAENKITVLTQNNEEWLADPEDNSQDNDEDGLGEFVDQP